MSTDQSHRILSEIYNAAKGNRGALVGVTHDLQTAKDESSCVYIDAINLDELKRELNPLVIRGWIESPEDTDQDTLITSLTDAGIQEFERLKDK